MARASGTPSDGFRADAAGTRPDRARGQVTGWPAVALVAVAFGVAMLGTTLPTPLYPLYEQLFGFGGLMTTVVFAVYAAGVIAGLLLFGHWSDQVGRRRMLAAGLALSAVSALVFVLHPAVGWLLVGRVISGLSAGIFTGTATATIVDLAPDPKRAGLVAAAVNMGGLGAGPLLAGAVSQYLPLPLVMPFVVQAALVVLALLALVFVPEPVRPVDRPQLRPQRVQVPAEMRGVFIRAGIAGFAGFAVLGLFTAVSPSFLGELLGEHNRALIGGVVFVLFLASTAGQTLSPRLGGQRALITGCGGLIAGMVLVGSSLPARSLGLLLTGAVIAGLGQGLSFRAGLGSVTAAGPAARRGEITSSFFVLLYVGIAIPVIGEGAASEAFGLIPSGITFATFVAALAATAVVLLTLRARADTP